MNDDPIALMWAFIRDRAFGPLWRWLVRWFYEED